MVHVHKKCHVNARLKPMKENINDRLATSESMFTNFQFFL